MSHSFGLRRRLSFFDESYARADWPICPGLRQPSGRFYKLRFLGAFQLIAPDGHRLEVGSKKAIALLALLAVVPSGERWRSWIQEKLWGSLETPRAQAGLRRELHRLRKLTDPYGVMLLHSDFRTVRLNLGAVELDFRQNVAANSAEFLEGLDLAGEGNFEDWLREMRSNVALDPNGLV